MQLREYGQPMSRYVWDPEKMRRLDLLLGEIDEDEEEEEDCAEDGI